MIIDYKKPIKQIKKYQIKVLLPYLSIVVQIFMDRIHLLTKYIMVYQHHGL